MKPKLPYQIRKRQFYGLTIFGGAILISHLAFNHFKANTESDFPKIEFSSTKNHEIILSEFDPNSLDEKQWIQLGFSEKQVKTILKYKSILGGNFSSKEQLKKCYAISEEKFIELEPYILLPETSSSKEFYTKKYQNFEKKELKISGKFNPDFYSESDWQKMGFSEKQSAAIVKYKN